MQNGGPMRPYFLRPPSLGFSRWTMVDSALAESLWGDSRVSRYLCASGIFSKDEISVRLALEVKNQTLYGIQYWPVFFRETEDLVGCCGLRHFDLPGGAYEFGVHLRPGYWRRGLGEEAGRGVLAYALKILGFSEIMAGHHPENAASRKLLMKLGFAYTHDSFYAPTGLMHPVYRLSRMKG